jgi:hypothetical protein
MTPVHCLPAYCFETYFNIIEMLGGISWVQLPLPLLQFSINDVQYNADTCNAKWGLSAKKFLPITLVIRADGDHLGGWNM